MKVQQVSDHCFAVLNGTDLVRDATSGLVNLGGGLVIDTQSDLPHARRMIELFSTVWSTPPWDLGKIFDGMHRLAKAKGLPLEF